MAPKSDDSIAEAIWKSANNLADDLDIVTHKRLQAWLNEHKTSKRMANVQDVVTLLAFVPIFILAGNVHPSFQVIVAAAMLLVCFTFVYRNARPW